MRIVLIISNLLSFDNSYLVSGRKYAQTCMRYAVIPERLTFDAGVGHQRGGGGRIATFALTFAGAGLPGRQ